MYTTIPSQQFKVYPYRYAVVTLFALIQLMTSVLLSTLNPIAEYLTQIYDQQPIVVNLGALLFALMHPLFTFPAAFIIDTYGTRAGIFIGCLFGIVGISLRLFVNNSFAWVIVGQVLAGIGRPFILNCQAKISANWFTSQSRGKITQILTLILNISLVIGIIIPSVVFGSYEPQVHEDGTNNYEQGKQLTFNLMLLHAIMGYVCFGLNLIFQRNKPPTPPSESENVKRDPFMVAVCKILRNTNYIKLLVAFGCFFGIFNGMSIVLSYMLKPWFDDILPEAVSFVGGSPIISGIIGVSIFGPMQRRSKVFKKWIIICMLGSSVAIALFYPLLETNSLVLVSLISAFNSFFLIPLVPIMLELGCELAFPVGQGTAVGFLFAMGNFSGFVFGAILSLIVQGNGKGETGAGLGFCFAMFVIGLLMILSMKEQLNRMNSQNRSSISDGEQIRTIEFKESEQTYKPPTASVEI